MKRYIGAVGESVRIRGRFTGAAESIRNWLRVADSRHPPQECNLHLAQRLAASADTTETLRNILRQGFRDSSMLFEKMVSQVPASASGGPVFARALSFMERGIEEGCGAVREVLPAPLLPVTLEEAFSRFREELKPDTRFRIVVFGRPKAIRPDVREQVYMICREALVNAMRHSQATRIEAEVEYLPSLLRVHVRDNGRGIDPKVVKSGGDGHWGLLGMRERAAYVGARLRLLSRLGAGTEVEISVPVHHAIA